MLTVRSFTPNTKDKQYSTISTWSPPYHGQQLFLTDSIKPPIMQFLICPVLLGHLRSTALWSRGRWHDKSKCLPLYSNTTQGSWKVRWRSEKAKEDGRRLYQTLLWFNVRYTLNTWSNGQTLSSGPPRSITLNCNIVLFACVTFSVIDFWSMWPTYIKSQWSHRTIFFCQVISCWGWRLSMRIC